MKKFLVVATAMLASAAVAQTAPVAQPTPTPPSAGSAPMVHPMRDKVTTRADVVQKVREHFGEMDSNRDGTVTTAEVEAARAKRFDGPKGFGGGHAMAMGDPNAAFDRLDANKDSYISRDEFTKGHERREERRIVRREERKNMPKESREIRRHVMQMNGPGGFGGRMVEMADTNKDGQITQAEAEAMALQHFDQMDTNRDGQVTPEERRASRQIMIQQKRENRKSGS